MSETITIHVRRHKIRRGGKSVDGYQAAFTLYGGVTCVDRENAVDHMRHIAERELPGRKIVVEGNA